MFKNIWQLFNPKYTEPVYYFTICCIVKDENSYLEEWMRYHLKAGAEHFYIYDNGSKVPVTETLQNSGLAAFATVTPMPGKAKQTKAYHHCLKHFGKTARWIAFIDVDEFIVAPSTGGHIPVLLKNYEAFGALGVNWLVFGSNGHEHRTNRPQVESFIRRAKDDFFVNQHIKSIVQPRYVKAVGNAHEFKYINGKGCVNENGMPISGSLVGVSVGKVWINHYYCRSLEEYQEKVIRGLADTSRRGRSVQEFYAHDKDANVVEDKTILSIIAQLDAE